MATIKISGGPSKLDLGLAIIDPRPLSHRRSFGMELEGKVDSRICPEICTIFITRVELWNKSDEYGLAGICVLQRGGHFLGADSTEDTFPFTAVFNTQTRKGTMNIILPDVV